MANDEASGDAAMTIDSSACVDCHEEQVLAFANNPHAALDLEGWDGDSCTSCHYGGAAHVEEGGGVGTIFAFSEEELPFKRTQVCLNCHGDTHPRFQRTSHAAAGITCEGCHSIHNPARGSIALLAAGDQIGRAGWDRIGAITETCIECHGDVAAQFDLNERHRLLENVLDCASCHDPHAPSTRMDLGGFKQQQCAECHADKSGPFVFEHGANRVEGCTACHSPHGSGNRHLLSHPRIAETCYSCHAIVPGFHSRFTLETVCTNCHSAIHGSNFHPAFLK